MEMWKLGNQIVAGLILGWGSEVFSEILGTLRFHDALICDASGSEFGKSAHVPASWNPRQDLRRRVLASSVASPRGGLGGTCPPKFAVPPHVPPPK